MMPSKSRIAAESADRLMGLLGLLHGLYFLHWTTHWQVQGNPFYGDHSLFERLYKALPDEIDTLAEKLVALHGRHTVDFGRHFQSAQVWVTQWAPEPNLYTRALDAERDLQAAVKQVYDDIKASGTMTLGLDDFLMSLANDHETHIYLLQQRLAGAPRNARLLDAWTRLGFVHVANPGPPAHPKPDAPSAEGAFFDKPRAREVREFAQSGATSNVPDVKITHSNEGTSKREERAALRESPPTPTEIVHEVPGSREFSTLSRYLVQTETPTERGVPQSREDIPKHPDIKTARRGR